MRKQARIVQGSEVGSLSAVPMVISTRYRLSGFRWGQRKMIGHGLRKKFEARTFYLHVGSPGRVCFLDVVL